MKVSIMIKDDSGRKFSGELVLNPTRDTREKGRPRRTPAQASSNAPTKPKHALKMLHEKGAFKQEKTFGAIEQEIEKLDCNFPKPTLMMALGSAPFLTKRGTKGNYRWVQKYRPGN